MTNVTAPASPAKAKTILVWVLRILTAAMFGFAAFMKLSGNPMMVEEFGHIGLGQGFRYLTGMLELVGVIATLVPSVSVFGALLLLAIDIGGFVTQVAILRGDVVHAIVIGAIVAALVYLQRHRLPIGTR